MGFRIVVLALSAALLAKVNGAQAGTTYEEYDRMSEAQKDHVYQDATEAAFEALGADDNGRKTCIAAIFSNSAANPPDEAVPKGYRVLHEAIAIDAENLYRYPHDQTVEELAQKIAEAYCPPSRK